MDPLPPTTVLVIDDNTDLAENIAEILGDVGVQVTVAKSADEALLQFGNESWDLVVTDVRMPGTDGIELLSLIKDRSPSTPVLVMTGYADADTITRAHESGALAVVHKPIDLDALLGLVGRVAEASTPILVVEDDVSLCSNLTDILSEQDGVLPHPASNVQLARRLAATIDFRAALIDLRLPDGDGLTLARELHKRPDGSLRPVIIMTGYPEALTNDPDSLARDERNLVVMTKPFQVPRLLERLRQMV